MAVAPLAAPGTTLTLTLTCRPHLRARHREIHGQIIQFSRLRKSLTCLESQSLCSCCIMREQESVTSSSISLAFTFFPLLLDRFVQSPPSLGKLQSFHPAKMIKIVLLSMALPFPLEVQRNYIKEMLANVALSVITRSTRSREGDDNMRVDASNVGG